MSPSFSLRPLAAALCAAFAVSLAGCGQSQPDRSFATDPNAAITGQFVAGQTLSAPVTAAELKDDTASFAILTLPSPAVRSGRVSEKQFINGWRQSMSLDKAKEGGDWNDLALDIQATPGSGGRGELTLSKPTQDSIRREILARFRGTPMRIVNRPMYNSLGPYGLAVGAGANGMRCAFAWQWVDNLSAAAAGEKASFFNNGETAASIRMRLCRRGVTADELAQWYEQLGVSQQNLARVADAMRRNMAIQGIEGQGVAGSASGLGPVVAAGPASAGGGGVTASVDSLESSLFGDVPAGAEAAARPSGARRIAHRRAAHRAQPAEPAPEPEAPAPASAPDGRRYLGPVSNGGGGAQYAASAPASAPASRGGAGFGAALDGLPVQAYRGPAPGRAITPYNAGQ